MKDIHVIKIDYTSVDPAYKCEETIKISEIPQPWIVPEEGPFYDHSVRLINGGLPLTPGDDYTFVTEATELTKKTGKPVSHHIELKNHVLTNVTELILVYQRVGFPIISRKHLLDELERIFSLGGNIDWETEVLQKPQTYWPADHKMDASIPEEMVGYGGYIQIFNALTSRNKVGGEYLSGLLEDLELNSGTGLTYIQNLRWEGIMTHARNYRNPHGVRKEELDLDNVENFGTASLQQDAEGTRTDLYSTPAGLKAALAAAEPDSEEYLFQNELPFSYYGSGIYLESPITAAFEGLGGDYENGCFVREGNGWIVGLVRQFDGRVKRLNYVYQETVLDKQNSSPVIPTYLPYVHNDITNAAIKPEMVVGGSGKDLLGIGEINNRTRLMVTLSKGTLNPASHSFYTVDTSAIWAAGNGEPANGLSLPAMTLTLVGDWVYIWVSHNSKIGIIAGSKPIDPETQNFQMRVYRFPVSSLQATNKVMIVPTPVTMTYDNVDRVRKTAQPYVQFYDITATGPVKKALYDFASDFVTTFSSPNKRQVVSVSNPANKNIARMKFFFSGSWSFVDGASNGTVSRNCSIDYELDVSTNTLTIDPDYVKPIMDAKTGFPTNYTEALYNKNLDSSPENSDTGGTGIGLFLTKYNSVMASWLPGIGLVGLSSNGRGMGPYTLSYLQLNETLNPSRDYETFKNPTWVKDPRGGRNCWSLPLETVNPYGVGGFPRHYSDIYEYNGKVNTVPIEQFMGTGLGQLPGYFCRMTEGAAGNDYVTRPELQASLVPSPIFGRAPNQLFGKTIGLKRKHGFRNWPQTRSALSTTHSIADYTYCPSTGIWKSSEDITGSQLDQFNERLRLPINYKWVYSPITRVLEPSLDPSRTVVMTKAEYYELIANLLGPHLPLVTNMTVHIDLFPVPGALSAGVQASTIVALYSITTGPTEIRVVSCGFSWTMGPVDAETGFNRVVPTVLTTTTKLGDGVITQAPVDGGTTNVLWVGPVKTTSDGLWEGVVVENSDVDNTPLRSKSDVYSLANNPNGLITNSQSGVLISTPTGRVSFRVRLDNRTATAPIVYVNPMDTFDDYSEVYTALDGVGMLKGAPPRISGGAISLMKPSVQSDLDPMTSVTLTTLVTQGGTYAGGNWTFFVNTDRSVVFSGYAMTAHKRAFDLRDYTNEYRSRKFYLYAVARGSAGEYELDEFLRYPNSDQLLVAVIETNTTGINKVTRYQPFAISGYPLTKVRDAGIPVSSGTLVETGTYKFIGASELYNY